MALLEFFVSNSKDFMELKKRIHIRPFRPAFVLILQQH